MFRYPKFAPIPVADQDRALAFYRDTLGLKLEIDDPQGAEGWRWIEFSLPGAQTRLLFERRRAEPDPEEPALTLIVDDVETVAADLVAKDVAFVRPPTETPWDANELFAIFRDSEGNLVQIGARRAAG